MRHIEIEVRGVAASGKSTIARWLAAQLQAMGCTVALHDDEMPPFPDLMGDMRKIIKIANDAVGLDVSVTPVQVNRNGISAHAGEVSEHNPRASLSLLDDNVIFDELHRRGYTNLRG